MPDPDALARFLVWVLLPAGPLAASAVWLRGRAGLGRAAFALVCAVPATVLGGVAGWALGGSAVVALSGRDFGSAEAAAGLIAGQALAGAAAQAALLAAGDAAFRRRSRRRPAAAGHRGTEEAR